MRLAAGSSVDTLFGASKVYSRRAQPRALFLKLLLREIGAQQLDRSG